MACPTVRLPLGSAEALRRPQVADGFGRGRRVDQDALEDYAGVHHPHFEGVIPGSGDLVLAGDVAGIIANGLLPIPNAVGGVVTLRYDRQDLRRFAIHGDRDPYRPVGREVQRGAELERGSYLARREKADAVVEVRTAAEALDVDGRVGHHAVL